MELRCSEILEKIFEWIPNSEGYETKIKPILISRDSIGEFNHIALLNRFAYTIVDQQRDVNTVVIPLWNTLLYYGMNREFICESPYAPLVISSIFQAYGHQQYHTKEDLKIQKKSGASRTDAFLQCYRERSSLEFLNLILEERDNLLNLFKILTKYSFISDKSAAFFLRDIEELEFSLVPIDSNVTRSLQRTGLFFTDFEKSLLDFEMIIKKIIPIKKRTDPKNFRVLSDKIFEICKENNKSPYKLNRYLFLLGADFCQNNRCNSCHIKDSCFYYNMTENEKLLFLNKIKS